MLSDFLKNYFRVWPLFIQDVATIQGVTTAQGMVIIQRVNTIWQLHVNTSLQVTNCYYKVKSCKSNVMLQSLSNYCGIDNISCYQYFFDINYQGSLYHGIMVSQ